jgi:hypothetical protein
MVPEGSVKGVYRYSVELHEQMRRVAMRTENRRNGRQKLLFNEEAVEMRLSADVEECSEPLVISILLHQVTKRTL